MEGRVPKISSVPSVREELNRKVINALEELLVGHSTGSISAREVKTAINSVYTVTSGLLDLETMDLMDNIEKGLDS